MQSNMYGCNCLKDNPAYRGGIIETATYTDQRNNHCPPRIEPGSLSHCKSEKVVECDYAVIPERENEMYDYNFKEGETKLRIQGINNE